MTVAVLFVQTWGCYSVAQGDMFAERLDVDPWDQARDARRYDGPHAVVAHPPCGTWGAYARQGKTHRALGDDDGCFAAAVASVRRWGGVLEHPALSSAWPAFSLPRPPGSGWSSPDEFGGRSIAVEQGHYGHPARKPTWLYAVRLGSWPEVKGGPSETVRCCQDLGKDERAATPKEFRNLLLSMARSVVNDAR